MTFILITFGKKILKTRNDLTVDEPVLPRKRKVSRRLDGGDAEPEYVDFWKLYYCLQYYEALDLIVNSIQFKADLTSQALLCIVTWKTF